MHRTDWLKEAKWGVFHHFLADTAVYRAFMPDEVWNDLRATVGRPDFVFKLRADFGMSLTVRDWNKYVDNFDVAALAKQLEELNAGYYFITIGQNSGFYCSPSRTYDEIVGINPSKCSERDLISDLHKALTPKGIKLMVYLPSGAPHYDEAAKEALEWQKGDFRNSEFQVKWESIIREWSERWGDKVAGWWFDGCYHADAMYRHESPPNFASFAAAARSCNSNSLISFNPGVLDPIITMTEHEDYTAGEMDTPLNVQCPGRWIEQAQCQMLSYLSCWWYWTDRMRFTGEQVIDVTKRIVSKGGVVTWDTYFEPNGHIPEEPFNQLHAISKSVK